MVEVFINITGKNNHISTRVNPAPASSHQKQRMMIEMQIGQNEQVEQRHHASPGKAWSC